MDFGKTEESGDLCLLLRTYALTRHVNKGLLTLEFLDGPTSNYSIVNKGTVKKKEEGSEISEVKTGKKSCFTLDPSSCPSLVTDPPGYDFHHQI